MNIQTDERTMSVAALVDEIRIARRRLSAKNPQQQILMQCEAAVVSLAQQLAVAKYARTSRVRRWWRRFVPAVFARVPQRGNS